MTKDGSACHARTAMRIKCELKFFAQKKIASQFPSTVAWAEIAQELLDLKRRQTMTAIVPRPNKIMWALCGSRVKLVVDAKVLRLNNATVVAAVRDFSLMVYYSVASSKITTGKY